MPEFTFGIPDFAARPVSRRVRILFKQAIIADTHDAKLLTQRGTQPQMFVPLAHVQAGLLMPGSKGTEATPRGPLTYYSIFLNGASAENAAWAYETPEGDMTVLSGHIAFDPAVVQIEVAEDASASRELSREDTSSTTTGMAASEAAPD